MFKEKRDTPRGAIYSHNHSLDSKEEEKAPQRKKISNKLEENFVARLCCARRCALVPCLGSHSICKQPYVIKN